MNKFVLESDAPGVTRVEVHLKRSAQAKRLSLRVSQLDGRVTLTLPHHASEAEATGFIREKATWLRSHVARFDAEKPVGLGSLLPLEDQMIRILPGQGRRPRLVAEGLEVPGRPEAAGARVAAFLKEAARDRLTAASDHYAALLGRPFTSLSLRDTRSRWGSCSSKGALMYSWRLVMAPPDILRYVAAHEVAHLAEMNHSAAFWARVQELYGPYRSAREWLRHHGAELHKYRFAG
ncbi:M48 family metallopeptidase [uncultured Lentibacter sp.]|jgi:predicted metal-dependent hydrolase|uniref:M48 family metallopeptidase n=1 Tax=uncultured Lentibacter sp. TaxID=1659309 RepID=UPI00262F67BE|nr:SprT family zinc-dependent metalloprotease [uncultured Lentibacter sp.]